MSASDQYDWWRAALAGVRGEIAPGSPQSGLFRERNGRAVNIWRDENGVLQCWTSSGYCPTKPDEIDDLFGRVCAYPVPEDVFYAFADDGQPWPKEYTVDLTIRETIAAGENVVQALAAKRARNIAAELPVDAAENERAVIGGNNPPEAMFPEQELADRIASLKKRSGDWLKSIGGAPRTQTEADIAANFKVKFIDLETEAETKRKAEKKPHDDAASAVQRRWKPVCDSAEAQKKSLDAIVQAWNRAEQKRLDDEARAETERLRKEAAEAAAANPGLPAVEVRPVHAVRVVSGTTGRGQGTRAVPPVFQITDIRKLAAYFASLDPVPHEFMAGCQKVVDRIAKHTALPGVTNATPEGKAA